MWKGACGCFVSRTRNVLCEVAMKMSVAMDAAETMGNALLAQEIQGAWLEHWKENGLRDLKPLEDVWNRRVRTGDFTTRLR